MDDQSLVPKSNFSYNTQPNNEIFDINNSEMTSAAQGFFGRQNTVFTNQTSSTVRQQSVVTRTIVRKKTTIVNGEVVETQEECQEVEPNSRELTTHSQTMFSGNDVIQGKNKGT